MIFYKSHLKSAAKKLRKESTKEENILWEKIRRNQILGIRFYRQKPLYGYIADFYAPKINLVIEIDGSQHLETANIEYDLIRSKVLASQEIIVKRYSNNEIRANIDLVMKDLYQYVHYCILNNVNIKGP